MILKKFVAAMFCVLVLLPTSVRAVDTLRSVTEFPEDHVGKEYTFLAGYGAGKDDATKWDWDGESGWWLVLRDRARKHVTSPGPDHYDHTEGKLIVVITKDQAKKFVVPLGRNYEPSSRVTFTVTKKTVADKDYYIGVVSKIERQ